MEANLQPCQIHSPNRSGAGWPRAHPSGVIFKASDLANVLTHTYLSEKSPNTVSHLVTQPGSRGGAQ